MGGGKTKTEQLLQELAEARRRVSELEAAEAEARRACEQYRQSASELEAIFRTLPDLLFRVDGDFTLLDYRTGRPEDLYAPPERFLGKQLREVLPAKVARRLEQATLKALNTGVPATAEYALRMPQGEQLYEARVVPLEDHQVIHLIRNITDRKRSEEALRSAAESLRIYARLVEGSPDLISVVNRGFIYCTVNPSYCRMHGRSRNQIVGHPVAEIHLPEEYERHIRPNLERSFAGEPAHYEAWITYRAAGRRYVDARYYPLRSDGQVEFSVVLVRDMTDRKLAEEALQESQERYRKLVEITSDWVWEVDEDSVYRYVSPRIRDLLGYSPEELLGRTPFDLMPPDEAARVEAAYWPCLAERQPFRLLDNANRHRDGHLVVLETSGVPIYDAQGRFRGFRGIDRDVTERKEAERMREEYLSLISHDLRAPLAVIMGQADWLRRLLAQRGLEREAGSAESILRGARRMNAMIQDLVESARLESGRMEMRKEPTDLLALVSEVAERVGSLEERKRLQVEVSEWVPPVSADPERIERVLVNLITNALKYSTPGTPVIIRVGRLEGEAVVSVTDQGPGIAPEDLRHLFERFFRAETAKPAQGLGLGLYITRLIVEAHGGRIWAESQVGKGSTFSFSLPLA